MFSERMSSSEGIQTKMTGTQILPLHHSSELASNNMASPANRKIPRKFWKHRRNTVGRRWRWRGKHTDGDSSSDDDLEKTISSYDGFPLVQSMLESEERRTASLNKEGSKQIRYPKSNSGWFRSLFVLEGRALDRIFLPWLLVTLNAVAWAVAYDKLEFRNQEESFSLDITIMRRNYIEGVLELVLTSTMAFLLVFRLNRSATRFWMARGSWGIIVVKCRAMVSSILLHGSHNPCDRDQAIRWVAAFAIASMNLARDQETDPSTVEGILDDEELEAMNTAEHSPLYAADQIRYHLGKLFGPTDSRAVLSAEGENSGGDFIKDSHDAAFSIALSDFRAKQLILLEKQLNVMIDEEGALERIKKTPLPLVYVTHLRTWLMLFLLTLPYFWEATLGYAIIPVECLSAFALLGLEGAASEVEAPFRKERTNHLDMDSYCLAILSNILQQAKQDANRRMKEDEDTPTKK